MKAFLAKLLQLPNPKICAGHTFRRKSTTLLGDSVAGIISIKGHGGFSIEQKNKISPLTLSLKERVDECSTVFKN